jgi:hypothetical protein
MHTTLRQLTTYTTGAMALALIAGAAGAQKPAAKGTGASNSLTWGPAPDAFPAGAKMAVERGDPGKSGEFIVRLSMPASYRIPPHWHPTDEHVRVRSGTLLVGMGDTLNPAKAMHMAAGDTGSIPAKMHHFAMTDGATVISIRAMGPFAMTYINPANDPRKKGKE